MTISELQEALDEALENQDINENTEVLFRHSVKRSQGNNSPADYVLTNQTDEGILICYDDGSF